MTYTVSSGTLNPSIPYHTIPCFLSTAAVRVSALLVIAEITRDNNGSLSDSSFDIESEENFDRRRGQQAQGGHSPSASGPSSRLANSYQQQQQRHRDAGGRTSARHGPAQPSSTTTTTSRHHQHQQQQQQQHESRRHHRGAVDPDAAPDRRSTAAAPGEHRASRGHSGSGGSHAAAVGGGGGSSSSKVAPETYGQQQQQQSRLFVALFDYDPQTMSPNQNAINDELPFTEGQIIKVREMTSLCTNTRVESLLPLANCFVYYHQLINLCRGSPVMA